MVPVEMFGNTRFSIDRRFALFSHLRPACLLLVQLLPPADFPGARGDRRLRAANMTVAGTWGTSWGKSRAVFERSLPAYSRLPVVRRQGAAQVGSGERDIDVIPVECDGVNAYITTWEVQFVGADMLRSVICRSPSPRGRLLELRQANRQPVIGAVTVKEKNDATALFTNAFYDAPSARQCFRGQRAPRYERRGTGQSGGAPTKVFRKVRAARTPTWSRATLKREQSNTSVVYAYRMHLENFPARHEGVNPDLEIGGFLDGTGGLHRTPPSRLFGDAQGGKGVAANAGIVQGWVANEGGRVAPYRWSLGHFFDGILTVRKTPQLRRRRRAAAGRVGATGTAGVGAGTSSGHIWSSAHLLGQRNGELYVALASDSYKPAFARNLLRRCTPIALTKSMHWREQSLRQPASGLGDWANRSRRAEKVGKAGSRPLRAPSSDLEAKIHRHASAATAMIISARCFLPVRTLSSSTSRANRRGR